MKQIRQILKGNLAPVIQHFKKEMKTYLQQWNLKKRTQVRKKIEYLENYQSRSVVVSKQLHNLDVFSILKEDDIAYVNYLMVQNGTIIQTHTVELQPKLDETEEEVLSFAIAQLRETFNSHAKEIIVPFTIDYPEEDIIITVPKGGDKKKLLELSEKNVIIFMRK